MVADERRQGARYSVEPTLPARPDLARRWPVWLFLGLVGASVVGLLAAPWPLAMKLYAVVHGLCAQRPSHSYALGGVRLPFDARMTGIYGGFLITSVFLLARGRWRAGRLAAPVLVAVLVLFVVVMGFDGVNSTLQDFRLPYLYAPRNGLRLATGLLMGTTLGVMLVYLLNNTLWAEVKDQPVLRGWRELGLLLALEAACFLLLVSGWGVLYAPVAVALVVGGVLAVLALALAVLVLVSGRENQFRRLPEVAGLAAAALLISYAVLTAIAAGRFYLEQFINMSALS